MRVLHFAYLILAMTMSCLLHAADEVETKSLIRNGSFEGSLRYWISNAGREKYWEQGSGTGLERENPAHGLYCVKVSSGELRSTPLALKYGKPITVRLSARAGEVGRLKVRLVPSKRDTALANGMQEKFMVEEQIGLKWQEFTFTIQPRQPDPLSNWTLVISSDALPFWVDAVSIVGQSNDAEISTTSYTPRAKLEVAADVTNLPGYAKNGNLLDAGFAADVQAAIHNPGPEPRTITVRWQLTDYAGERAVGESIDRPHTIAAGETVIDSVSLPLTLKGLQLARVSIIDENSTVLDCSDVPLTVLPFRKAASDPDPRERFGCSLRGESTMRLGQAIGFRWCRWWWNAPMGWAATQPNGPDSWNWPDAEIDLLARHGYSVDYVLYGVPKWAQVEESRLPADMQWKADDPRWEDLDLQTSWDRYVTAVVSRYADKSVVWEFANEPELGKWKTDEYVALARRTARLVKQVNPKSFFLTNQTDPNVGHLPTALAREGVAPLLDAHSWHNYGTGAMGNARTIRTINNLYRSGGNPKTEVWFNEGGTFVNSSQDYLAHAIGTTTPPEWAHLTVRSLAEMLSAGADRHIMFHIGYEDGYSRGWWDWLTNGGTELWDTHGHPTVAVATWNVLIDQLGLSEPVVAVKGERWVGHVFDDLRNRRGVAIVWAVDETDAVLRIPEGWIARDVMGNDLALKGTLVLPADGRPYYLYTADSQAGEKLAEQMKSLLLEDNEKDTP